MAVPPKGGQKPAYRPASKSGAPARGPSLFRRLALVESVDVAVVGGGIMGLCAAWRLAAAGHETVLFERYAIGHDRGSSHGATRIFRYGYADPMYVRMAQASLPLWRELENGTDELVRITGGVDTGEPATVEATARALESCGARVDRLDAEAIAQRFPWLAIDADAIFSPDTGVIAASRAVRAAARRARDAGATIEDDTRVLEVRMQDDAVTVRTDAGETRARRAVVTAGGWTPQFLATFGVEAPLAVTKESVFYHAGGDDVLPFIDWSAIPKYAVPAFAGAAGVKVGEHGTGRPVSPEQRDFEPDERSAERLRSYVTERFPTLEPDPIAAETCLYTSTPDNHFLIDTVGPVVVASPCSGHGFKFGPLIGETLACLAGGRTPPVDVAAFRLDRWERRKTRPTG